MNTIIVHDSYDEDVYGIITTKITPYKVQRMIDKLKDDNPEDYNTEMLKEMLLENGIDFNEDVDIVLF